MKPFLLPRLALLLAALLAPLSAQTPAPAAKPLPATRVAYVNTAAFINEAGGIKKLVKVLKDMEQQFQPRQNEILGMKEKYTALANEVGQLRANPASDKTVIMNKISEAQALQKQIKSKTDEAQKDYNKRSQEVRDPIDEEISKELPNFIHERGIDLLLDGSVLQGALLVSGNDLNVTADFIAYFNARHP